MTTSRASQDLSCRLTFSHLRILQLIRAKKPEDLEMSAVMTEPKRLLPRITELNHYFWCGGADGRLRVLHCDACGYWIHPYAARCPACHSAKLSVQPVSGRGQVAG